MNYSELKKMWVEWSHRPDLTGTTILDDIEQLTRARIGRDLRTLENTEVDNIIIPAQGYELDPRVKEIQRLRDGEGCEIKYVSPENFYKRNSGKPNSYTVEGGLIFLDIAQEDTEETLAMELVSYKEPVAMVNDEDTRPALTQWPNIYLYAGLAQIMVFTQNMELEAVWEQKYRGEVAAANEQWQRVRIGSSPIVGN